MNVSLIGVEPRSAETVHSGGELVTPGPAHSWARHHERIRAGVEKASLCFSVLLLVSLLITKSRPVTDTPRHTARMTFKSI